MRKTLFLFCALLAALAFPLPARAQTTTPAPANSPAPAGGNPFLDEKTFTTETLHNAIIKRPYTFEVDGWTMHIHFDPNGTGAE